MSKYAFSLLIIVKIIFRGIRGTGDPVPRAVTVKPYPACTAYRGTAALHCTAAYRVGIPDKMKGSEVVAALKRIMTLRALSTEDKVEIKHLLDHRTTQLEYKFAEYLSVVKRVSNRRLISRFRTGCHGLRVDTGRWADGVHLDRTDRLCLVCKLLDCVEVAQRTAISLICSVC